MKCRHTNRCMLFLCTGILFICFNLLLVLYFLLVHIDIATCCENISFLDYKSLSNNLFPWQCSCSVITTSWVPGNLHPHAHCLCPYCHCLVVKEPKYGAIWLWRSDNSVSLFIKFQRDRAMMTRSYHVHIHPKWVLVWHIKNETCVFHNSRTHVLNSCFDILYLIKNSNVASDWFHEYNVDPIMPTWRGNSCVFKPC